VMFRHYEIPPHLQAVQHSDPKTFEEQIQYREDYRRLRQLEGKEVEADLVRLQGDLLRATNVRLLPSVAGASGVPGSSAGTDGTAKADGSGGESAKEAGFIVRVYPLPYDWGNSELCEHFGRYGNVECLVEKRVTSSCSGGRNDSAGKVRPPNDKAPSWALGALKFEDALRAELVVQTENGAMLGSREEDKRSATVEIGAPRRSMGRCEGVVMTYLQASCLGIMRSSQVEGDIHFEASKELRESGQNLQGLRVEGLVDFGCDGRPQAKDVRVRLDEPEASSSAAGGQEEEQPTSRKKKKSKHDTPGMPGMPLGMPPGMPPGMLMGMPMGLRPRMMPMGGLPFGMPPPFMAAQAMMMNHLTQMGMKAMKKQKKDKKDKSSNKDEQRHGGRSIRPSSRKRRRSERSEPKELEEESNNDEPSELDREASCSEDQPDMSGELERAERRQSGSFESRDHGRGTSIRLVSRRHARNNT